MAYNTGILRYRVKILNQMTPAQADFGETTEYAEAGEVWADVTWSKGVKSLREGALDAYDTVMIRMRWHDQIRRDHRIEIDGTTYQIDSFHASRQDNTIQITATELTAV
jgi:SPP1 family predicted phage head-tail adaptor